jgi:hypothetical protein
MAHPLVNIIEQPRDKVISAYNCIQFKYEVTDYITSNGSKSYLEFQVDAGIPANETVIIFGQQFLFTADPNTNGHNIALGVNEFEQRDFIYDTLLTNYEVTKNFNILKVGTDKISLTAKLNGNLPNITFFLSSINDLQELSNLPGSDVEKQKTYKIIGCLQLFENNEWVTKEELVRDVYLIKDGNALKAEVTYKLQEILSSLYINTKPDLNATAPFIDQNASFEFRLSIVDFKSATGQVGQSGFFAVGEPFCAVNGKQRVQNNEVRMLPYYNNLTDGFTLPLNQIPSNLKLCCDNNGFLSVLIDDQEKQGWAVEVYGNIYYSDGNIEFNHRFGGFTGTGSDVLLIPIGPKQIDICNDFLGGGDVDSYNYQAFIFTNASAPNLFPDGDGGTFETSIAGMVAKAGLVMSQTPNGYIGNGLLLEELQDGAPYTPFGSTLLTHINDIAFEKGKVYFLEAWIKVNGLDCDCISNMFTDGNYGTFDGNDPLDLIVIISGASGQIVNGYDNLSLLVSDLDQSPLIQGSYIVTGDSNIFLLSNSTYKLTAWVKVLGIDCLLEPNIFIDGNNGQFNGPTPLDGIVELSGITKSSFGGNLYLATLESASIVDGSRLFRGDTGIQFYSGFAYTLSLDLIIDNFNCSAIGNLFTDGDYGTFENNINNIIAPVTNTVLSQLPSGRLGGNCALIENNLPLVLAINTAILLGDTPILFSVGKTYELTGWIDLEGMALFLACSDPTGLSLGIRIVDTLNVGDITLVSFNDAVYNSSTCGLNPWIEVKYRFTANNLITKRVGIRIISGPSFLEPASQEILFDDFTVREIGATNQDIKFNIGLQSGIGANGTEVIDSQLILDDTCSNLSTLINVKTTLNVTNDFVGKVALITTGLSNLLSNPSTEITVQNVNVLSNPSEVRLQMYGDLLPSGSTQVVNKYLSLGSSDCSNLNKWVQVETEIQTSVISGNIKVGLQATGVTGYLKDEDVEIMIDSISLVDTQNQNLEFYISSSDGADELSTLKIDCDKLGSWNKLVSSYTPSVDTNESVLIRVKGRTECIDSGDVTVDEIRVTCREDGSASSTPLQTVQMMNSSEDCCCDDCCNEEFAYLNELGQFDFIHFECKNEIGTIISKVNIEVCTDCDDDISTEGSKTVSASSKDRFVVNARIEKDRRDQLKIFGASIEIYHIVNNQYYPIELLNEELDTVVGNSNFVDINLEFVYRFENPTLKL